MNDAELPTLLGGFTFSELVTMVGGWRTLKVICARVDIPIPMGTPRPPFTRDQAKEIIKEYHRRRGAQDLRRIDAEMNLESKNREKAEWVEHYRNLRAVKKMIREG